MTDKWNSNSLGKSLEKIFPDAVDNTNDNDVWIKSDKILLVCEGLRDLPEFKFDLLNSLTAVDYIDYFEVIYHITSLPKNASAVIKSKVGFGRNKPIISSVVNIWRGADYQEREVWDLLGIEFSSHPNMKRLFLWEGYPGHPLRKDYITYDQSIVTGDKK